MGTLILTFVVSAVICGALTMTKRWHLAFTGDRCDESDHKLHSGAVPRIGGLGLFLGGLVGLAQLSNTWDDATARQFWALWGCVSLAFLVGFAEDLTRKISPAWRYLATVVSALLFSFSNDWFGITAVGVPIIDMLFRFTFVQVLFFVFAVGSVAHAFNIIDGQNGLCSGVCAMVYGSLAAVAFATGQLPLGTLALAMTGANLGFFVWNYPFGKIFLGDAGAYFNGGMIGILCVMIVEGSPAVSPWYALAVLAYPVWETLFSIYRRKRDKKSFSEPDLEHLHSLYYLHDRTNGGGLLKRSSAPRLWIIGGACTFFASMAFSSQAALMMICAGLIVSYMGLYRAVQSS